MPVGIAGADLATTGIVGTYPNGNLVYCAEWAYSSPVGTIGIKGVTS